MDFQTFNPVNGTLRKYIDYYYFFKSDDPEFSSIYYSFPNITTPLNIHRNIHAGLDLTGMGTRISGSEESNYMIILDQVREIPLKVEWKGRLDKVTIVFKPLGLNNFITAPFAAAVPAPLHIFTAWDGLPGYADFLGAFYSGRENAERVAILEDFLLTVYSPFSGQEILEKALGLLSDFEEALSVDRIAAALGLTSRTFNRLFQKHTGMSPIGYKKVARFRQSLENKLFNEKLKKLTEIAYESNFYDQSYFIKIYNKLAGTNPRAFFESIEKLGDDRLIFQFLGAPAASGRKDTDCGRY